MIKGGKNSEGYSDPTATAAIGQVSREQSDTDRRVNEVIKVLKYIIRMSGFELAGRICLIDIKTGREYR